MQKPSADATLSGTPCELALPHDLPLSHPILPRTRLAAGCRFPKKKILRIRLAEEFDGRVSAEFRQRDDESGDKGVSLLMGRVYATRSVEPQCVLFDEALSDLECARWWQRHQGRKSFQPTKMGAAMQRTRALGEGGGGKAKGLSSKS